MTASSHEIDSRKRKIERSTPISNTSFLLPRNKSKRGGDLKKTDQVQTEIGSTKCIATSHESDCMKGKQSTSKSDARFLSPLNKSNDGKELEVFRSLLPEMTETSTAVAIDANEALPPCENENCHRMTDTFSGLSEGMSAHHPLYTCQKKNKFLETDIFSSPSEGLSDHLLPNICLDTVRGVLNCDSSSSHPEAADLSLLPQFHTAEKERCDSSKTQVQCSQINPDLHSSIHSMNIFGDDQIQQQIEGVEEQITTISDRTGGESKENVPYASVEGVSPENQLASHSNVSINFRGVPHKGHKVFNYFDLPECSLSLEGQRNNGDQCCMAIEDGEHEDVMHAFHYDEATRLNRNGEHKTFVHDPNCDDATLKNINGEHETSMHDHDGDSWTPQNRSREHESLMHDQSSYEVTPENRKNRVFTKSYSLWKDVEEEIHLMPQQPHFQPLKETIVLLREGKAIGYMLSFTDLLKQTSRATLDVPESTFDSMLQALNDLEVFGFDVHQLRDRLEELLRLKKNQLRVHAMVKQCERQIIKEKHEDELLKSKISDLDTKLLEINEERQMVEFEQKTRGSSIAALERQLRDLMEEIQSTTRKFNFSAAAPW